MSSQYFAKAISLVPSLKALWLKANCSRALVAPSISPFLKASKNSPVNLVLLNLDISAAASKAYFLILESPSLLIS
jgi:hypothetical protein